MDGSDETRIVLLGKTGSGKSSLGNAILGENLFKVKSSSSSETDGCRAESKMVNGRRVTVVDTPGFFDTNMSEKELKDEILKCIQECAPGPHAFLILLEAGRYTKQEEDIINKVLEYFSEEALKYAAVVFTHGNQLAEGVKIQDFVRDNKALRHVVRKCGGGCHVIDNKYWDNNTGDDRSNQFQVAQLLNTVENMKNTNGYYTNDILQAAATKKTLIVCSSVTVGALLGAFFGSCILKVSPYTGAAIGAAVGGIIGYEIGVEASTPQDAVLNTIRTVAEIGMALKNAVREYFKP